MDDEFLALLVQFSVEETRELSARDLDLQLAVRFQREDLEHYQRERGRPQRQRFSNILGGIVPNAEGYRAILPPRSAPTNRWPSSDENLDADENSNESSTALRDSMGDVEMKQYCSSCGEETPISNSVIVPCGDFFCSTCLNQWFRTTCGSESSFPPSCCGQTIPVGGKTEILLDADTLTLYNEKEVEFETAAEGRIYCHRCSAFILHAIERSILHSVLCIECTSLTCILCKGKAHSGMCPPDPATQQVLTMAQKEKWRQCKYGEMIELVAGCNHMTCNCGRQFCYLCGELWRTCDCPRFGPRRGDINEGDRFIDYQ